MSSDPALPSSVWQAVLPWFAKTDRWRLPIGELGDQLVQAAVDALRLRYPSVTPDDASLTFIGRDRRIPRAPDEPPEAYARRLNLWLELWGIAGLPLGLLYAAQSFIFPGYPTVRLVERSGLWHTLDEGASAILSPYDAMTVAGAADRYVPPVGASVSPRAPFWLHYGTWPDWDSISHPANSTRVHDYLLFVYPPSYPFQGEYDNDIYYDVSDSCWGLDVPQGTVDTLRELIRLYSRAGSHCISVVFPDSTALYAPNATPDAEWPDGRWGWEAVDDGMGNVVATRNPRNRYLLGFP